MIIELIKKHKFKIFNILLAIFFLALPYILFKGKYYIGGDDTRLEYIFPWEYFKYTSFPVWQHFSALGSFRTTQFLVPFLLIWSLFDIILNSKLILGYLAFSLPMLLGFFTFRLMLKEFLRDDNNKYFIEIIIGALIFIFSPIIAINQIFLFLSTIWLMPLIPFLTYCFFKYIRTENKIYIAYAVIVATIFSLGLFSIPWVLGYIIPLFLGMIIFTLFVKNDNKIKFIKKSIQYIIPVSLSQIFWAFPLLMTSVGNQSSNFVSSSVFSKSAADTFTPVVNATAVGNIFYPLINLFHRQITFDFDWQLRFLFKNFYDKTLLINFIYLLILFIGFYYFKKNLNKDRQKIFLFLITSFVISLYLNTVNIGPLRDLFISLGGIPGVVMFRNFYDKFAMGYVMIFASVLTFCLVVIKNKLKSYKIILILLLIVIGVNAIKLGDIINAPLWTTQSTGRNINIPTEYLNFMKDVEKKVSPSNYIFSVPFGTGLYTVIKDTDSNSVYMGTSPVILFTGVNDFSGWYSFQLYSIVSNTINKYIIDRNYIDLRKILYSYNINYIILTKNIPPQVKKSWVYEDKLLKTQDQEFIENLTNRKLAESKNGNYVLYEMKDKNKLINGQGVEYQKINDIKFKIYIKNLKGKMDLSFNEPFHGGWKLFLQKDTNKDWCVSMVNAVTNECKSVHKFIEGDEIGYFFDKSVGVNSHNIYNKFANKWTIDSTEIKQNFSSKYFKLNSDGSIDLEMVLYFVPQSYFYSASIVSIFVFITAIIFIIYKFYKHEKKK